MKKLKLVLSIPLKENTSKTNRKVSKIDLKLFDDHWVAETKKKVLLECVQQKFPIIKTHEKLNGRFEFFLPEKPKINLKKVLEAYNRVLTGIVYEPRTLSALLGEGQYEQGKKGLTSVGEDQYEQGKKGLTSARIEFYFTKEEK